MTDLETKGSVAVVFADGGSRGNPGPSGCGAVVKSGSSDGEVLAKRLQRQFEKFTIEHVRREYNKEADLLANQAMDKGE